MLSQLTSRTTSPNEISEEYTYSVTGTLQSKGEQEHTYDTNGKLLHYGSTSYDYDALNNRVLSVGEDIPSREYTWNQHNLLERVTDTHDESTTTVDYTYGAGNLLASRTDGDMTHDFVWDIHRAIPVVLSDGEYEYIYKSQHDRIPIAQVHLASDRVELLHSDLNGSIIATTDMSGNSLQTTSYKPYGKNEHQSLSNLGYAGEWTDDVTGYIYLRARWLDVDAGVFLSEDPMVQITMNAFGYTDGNPLLQTDPLGLFTLTTEVVMEIISTTSTITGLMAASSATLSVIAPITAPLTAPLAITSGMVSFVTGAVSTTYTCSTMDAYSCGFGIATTAISGLGAIGKTGRALSSLGESAIKPINKNLNKKAFAEQNARRMNRKVGYTALSWSSPSLEGFGDLISWNNMKNKKQKGENEC